MSFEDMILQVTHTSPHWVDYAVQGLADAAIAAEKVCPAFGEKGWAPFCFLQGNPVFNTFDQFQLFIQQSIVSLHDVLKDKAGIENAYGPSIIIFTILVRVVIFPLTYQQLLSSQKTQSLTPKIAEIKDKFPDDKNIQNQMIAALYQETQVNPLAGCLPALVQIPVFLSLYRSFLNLASASNMNEPFLWIPNLQGPVFGSRSLDWISKWNDGVPTLGWHDTLAYLSIPLLLVVAQTISLRVLTPPSDDPAVQKTQRILKYLPLVLGYFALSVPSGLGVYWVINNFLSTATTGGIKEYFKANPLQVNLRVYHVQYIRHAVLMLSCVAHECGSR
jgi:YidC/Oxa1 family membrane protein insertase